MTILKAPERFAQSTLAIVVGLVGLLVSLYLLYHHIEVKGGYLVAKSFCSWSETVDCDAVVKSDYSEFMGQPLPVWSSLYFLVLIGLGIFANKSEEWTQKRFLSALGALTAVGLFSALAFIAISTLVVKKICVVCFAVHGLNILFFLSVFFAMKKENSSYLDGLGEISGYVFAAFDVHSPRRSTAFFAMTSALLSFFLLATVGPYFEKVYFQPRKMMAALNSSSTVRLEDFRATRAVAVKEAVDAPLIDRDFVRGPVDAKLSLAVFSDFECPACRRFATLGEELLKEFNLRIVYKNFPLDQACNPRLNKKLHEFACTAAIAARCAGLQGEAQFWRAHDHLMSGEKLTSAQIDELPRKLGLDIQAYTSCLNSGEGKKHMSADITEGTELNILGTPSIFINGRPLTGSDPTTVRGALKSLLQ